MPGYSDLKFSSQSTAYNSGFFNKTLRRLSQFGQTWQSEIFKNTQLVGVHENPNDPTNLGQVAQENSNSMYDVFSKRVISKILEKKSIAYLDRSYFDKRKILQQYSIKDEIRSFVTKLSDEVIIYNEDNYFCYVKDLPDDFSKTIRDKFSSNFVRLYNTLGLDDGITAWNIFKEFLINGHLCFELIYDDKQKNIIGLNKIDPITVVPATDPTTQTVVWVQYPDVPNLRKIILDTHIIYLSYSNNFDYSETSYIEPLIRPYNQLKLLEQTKLLYNINQASIYKKLIIPTNGLTKIQAKQQVYQLMSEYHEDVQWDDTLGTVSINGSSNIPHSKDYWFPSSDGNTPEVEIMNPGGIDLNEDVMLTYFSNILKKASKLPSSRFDESSGGGSIYDADSSDITREEIEFKTFVKRLRTIFRELISKPLRIQMILDFPELENDHLFKSAIKIEYNSNELFEEWKKLKNMAKRAEIVSTLSSNFVDKDGNSYLHQEWLARNIMKLSEKEIEENNKFKFTEPSAPAGEGGGESSGGFGGGGGESFGGGESTPESSPETETPTQEETPISTEETSGTVQAPPAPTPQATNEF
jgi:hypothetical protein